MSSLRKCLAALIGLGFLVAAPASAQTNNLWVMWEEVPVSPGRTSEFRSHLMFNVPRTEAEDFFYSLIPSARRYGAANMRHETSPFCAAKDQSQEIEPTIDDVGREPTEKVMVLKGLEGVFADLRGVRGPPGYRSDFGEDAHAFLQRALAEAGIPLLTREQAERTIGRPTLVMRFSPEVDGCRPWTISLTLKENVVPTRDTSILINTTTWSSYARQSEEDIDYGVYDAVEDAIKIFVADYLKANGPNTHTAAVAQR